MKSVNIGIDLGTTNSLIAAVENNKVRVFKNPVGQKETLASVVAFRPERMLIGDKAREYLTKDAVNVFGGFKRKMGTDEKYYVVNLDENVTPVELSTYILKELKTFLQTNEPVEAVVITIPASFDSMQSNATLKAGLNAGFTEVFLLQEPIAASLAFFNSSADASEKQEGYWLVYDLGGGTFDVALVKSTHGELKVIDHEGNNFLGGMDFDAAIIHKIIVPAIIGQTGINDLEEEFSIRHGKYEMLYYQAMYYAEEAKKELSQVPSTVIEFSAMVNGCNYDFYIPVTKTMLDELFVPLVQETISLLNKILARNNLTAATINQIILVGGSTYLPQVRELLTSQSGIPINFSIDPTTSVAVGAAFYASNKYYEPKVSMPAAPVEAVNDIIAAVDFEPVDLLVKLSCNKSSRDLEEILLIICKGDFDDKSYRIIRSDGGFDTGILKMKPKKTEFLPLLPALTNLFVFHVYDSGNNELMKLKQEVSVTQGMYNIDGQPLPHDISIEVDDLENKTTKLEVIFERNSLLPQKRTLYREISKTIKKDTKDSIIINILEGEKHSRASSNLTIGCIEISGRDIPVDLVKGSDIEIELELTESRVLNSAVFLTMTQQSFKNVFSIHEKTINLTRLREQFTQLENELTDSIQEFQFNNDEIWEINATAYLSELQSLKTGLLKLKEHDVSDEKYIIAQKIMRISRDFDKLGGNERLAGLLETYFSNKEVVAAAIKAVDFDMDEMLRRFQKLEQGEASFIRSKNVSVIENRLQHLHNLHWLVLSNTTGFLISKYIEFKGYGASEYKDYAAAKSVIKLGDTALEKERYAEFRRYVYNLSSLLKNTRFHHDQEFKGTGIG